MDQQFLTYFNFDIIEIIGLLVFVLLCMAQLFYYFKYYKKPYKYALNTENIDGVAATQNLKVSVIIVSENEVESLSRNLSSILEQDYPNFEVIVVNNGSTDESDELLRSLELLHPNLYHTYLPYSNDKMMGRRKLALTLGVKAAKGDVLLFTEPYAKPTSNRWITRMVEAMSEGKDVVLGYSFYQKTKQFYNRVARFDNHLFSMEYLSMALSGKPYIGTYRNLAFRKHLFFDRKGFASLLHLENGEEILINRITTSENTAVALSQDSFVETELDGFSLWKQIKKSYLVSKSYSNSRLPRFFDFETFSRFFFYLLFLGLVVYSSFFQEWGMLAIAILIFLLQIIAQLLVISTPAKYFYSGKFNFSLPLMDIVQPFYDLKFKKIMRR